jgi:hypothetical protein
MKRSQASIFCAILIIAIFLAMSANANAPFGHYVVGASGTVYDTGTKLTWQQAVPSTELSWANASAYCAGLGSSLGGKGWRLPTIKELVTIVDFSQPTAPFIDRNAFPQTPSGLIFFSSSASFGIDFANGLVSSIADPTQPQETRCVR